jgi:hypothetical protein
MSYIQVTNPGVPDWKVVAGRTGLDFSSEACQYIGLPAHPISCVANFPNRKRFAKIKKEDAEAFSATNANTEDSGNANTEDYGNSNTVDGADTTVTTPKPKAKRAPRTPKSKSTGGKRGAKLLDGEQNEEEEPETPTKKLKATQVKEELTKVKEEPTKVKGELVEDDADQI